MTKKSYILRIIKEDVLRILIEKKERLYINNLENRLHISLSLLSDVLSELEREGLIKKIGSYIVLTEIGNKKSKSILRKHLILENYFKKTHDEETAHKKAHTLEHYVSEEVIRNIKKMDALKEGGVLFTNFSLQKEGLISAIDLVNNHELFERLVSMGIFPGKKIKILGEIPGIFVIKVDNKKFALAKEIANEIKILEV
jgi:Mn-dependent DtxR family transcriptional regulator/Fe2+ transport system protein FeoA